MTLAQCPVRKEGRKVPCFFINIIGRQGFTFTDLCLIVFLLLLFDRMKLGPKNKLAGQVNHHSLSTVRRPGTLEVIYFIFVLKEEEEDLAQRYSVVSNCSSKLRHQKKSQQMAYPSITLFFLFLPLFSHAHQSCPQYVNYTCPDFHGNSVLFPFTNKSQPDCGLCTLECENNSSTRIQCGKQGSSYKTKGIFPDNGTVVLVYPGLHDLISHVCNVHQTDSVTVPNAPLTSLTILNLVVFFRCHKEIGAPPILQGPSKTCGDDIIYGPYPIDESPDFPPPGCSTIKLPNSTDDSFSIKYYLPGECSQCASDRTRCFKMNNEEIHCPKKGTFSIF